MGKVETKILASLHRVEEGEFMKKGVKNEVIFANVEADTVSSVLSIPDNLPAVVYFKNSQPVVYKGISAFILGSDY